MIRRTLLTAIAIVASVVVTACSDMTAPKTLASEGSSGTAMLASRAAAATLVATIHGGGTANMDDGMGSTVWGAGIKLFSDGSATGEFHCVDQHGSAPGYPGNIWGKVTSWRMEGSVVVFDVVGKLVGFPGGHPQDVAFTVKVQRFGGAGVGHWTLEIGGFIFCYETLTSGQIVYREA